MRSRRKETLGKFCEAGKKCFAKQERNVLESWKEVKLRSRLNHKILGKFGKGGRVRELGEVCKAAGGIKKFEGRWRKAGADFGGKKIKKVKERKFYKV
jgi:hypothetical protein